MDRFRVVGGLIVFCTGRRKRNLAERLIHGARLLDVTLRLALSFSHKNTPINTARYFREEEIPADIRAYKRGPVATKRAAERRNSFLSTPGGSNDHPPSALPR